ncbi:hypothetical protein FO519_008754 [Halicephalobus sp. NKZ332]|nr:hypothetical protein FO519_008754 [Halicephalobus sp. NKZ332]
MSELIPKTGDLLVFNGVGYCHWAVVSSPGKIIHVTSANNELFLVAIANGLRNDTTVKEEELDFLGVIKGAIQFMHVDNSLDSQLDPLPVDEIVSRARSKIGPWDYDVVKNNSEHFAKWCRYGETICQQLPYAYNTGHSTGAGVGSITLGPARVHLPNVYSKEVDEDGRREIGGGAHLAGAELAFIRANVGVGGRVGAQKNSSGLGFTAETEFAEARVGPVDAKLGLGVSTGFHNNENGVGAEVLGTGFHMGKDGIGLSLLGSKLKFSW